MRIEKICGTCKKIYGEDKDFLTSTSQWRLCASENLWFNCGCGSTLMIPKGKFPWYSPDLGMTPETASLFNGVASLRELPHIPSAVMELQKMLTSPEVETPVLVKALKQAPIIAAEVINLTEKLRAIRETNLESREEQNLDYCVTFIGRKQLSSLVAVASLQGFHLETTAFSQEEFWRRAFLTASISELLSKHFYPQNKENIDKAYLGGCLCNIGKIVAAHAYPVQTDHVYQQVNNPKTQCTWEYAEEAQSAPNHCILGEIGAAFWGFPIFTAEVIRFHHSPPDNGTVKEPELCNIVCLANMLTHWINLEPHRIDDVQLEIEEQYFNLTRPELEKMVERITPLVKNKP